MQELSPHHEFSVLTDYSTCAFLSSYCRRSWFLKQQSSNHFHGAPRNLFGNQMPSYPYHFNNSLLKGSSELGFLIHGMRQKIQETCCDTEKGTDISRERGRCSLSQHWHRDRVVSTHGLIQLDSLLPVLHPCFASYSCHKYHLFQVLQGSDLGKERCLKRISTHLLV